jgi:hypothetical protein
VAAQAAEMLLRSSADPDGSILAVTHGAWRDLTARVKQQTLPGA